MRDELDDDDDKGALIIGIGPPKGESGGDLEPLMAAFARALKTGNFGKAARIFDEAVNVCDEHAGEDDDEESSPFKKRGSDDDDDDYLS